MNTPKQSLKQKLILYLEKKLLTLKVKYFPKIPIENPFHLSDLSAKSDAEKSKDYLTALRWAIENTDVFNIALTGAYGSGKSSILRAFKEKYQDYNYLPISLASFRDEIEEQYEKDGVTHYRIKKPSEAERIEQHRLVELSILQQIFYRETDELLPESRFKRIKKFEIRKHWKKPVFMIIWGLCLYYVSNHAFREEFYSWKSMDLWIEALLFIISATFFLFGTFRLLIEGMKILASSKFSKINLTGGEIEMSNDISNSILNKHLDEILYFFQVQPYNVVILEDLDRFNDPEIFTKLRELNLLLNNSAQVGRRIVFIYAVRDDIFRENNRTKFFDFLLPVLPAINHSNSINVLTDSLEKAGFQDLLKKKFLYDISLYISDMRILKNIFNEFMLYNKQLTGSSFDPNELMGMIVYKNIYPQDFAALHVQEGMVYSVMSQKSELTKKISDDFSARLVKAKEELRLLQDSVANGIKELRMLYVQHFVSRTAKKVTLINVNGNKPLSEMSEDENFKAFQNSSSIGYYYYANYGSETPGSGISFAELEKLVDPVNKYEKRAQLITDSKANAEKGLQKEISELIRKIQFISTRPFKMLLVENKSALEHLDEKFRKEKLLVYLLRGGYLNEMYEHYMSYFYPKSLTDSDMVFLRAVRNQEALKHNYELTNIEELLHRLEPEDFILEELLNFNLVDYLFKHKSNYPKFIKTLNAQLTNVSEASLEFLKAYFPITTHFDYLIRVLYLNWQGMWAYISREHDISPEVRDKIMASIIRTASFEEIEAINEDFLFTRYIIWKTDFLTFMDENSLSQKACEVIKHFEIVFGELDDNQVDSPSFEEIYHNNHYQINEHMISLMARKKGEVEINADGLATANFTTVLASKADALISYLKSDIETYLSRVGLKLPGNIKESEDTVVYLLTENIGENEKMKIIEIQETQLSDFTKVEQSLWKPLLNFNKIRPNWENVLTYFEMTSGIDDDLTTFLNDEDNYKFLATEKLENEIFVIDIIQSRISDEAFDKLILSISEPVDDEPIFSSLTADRLDKLIRQGVVKLSEYNFNGIKSIHSDSIPILIEKNIGQFFEDTSLYPLLTADYLALMESGISSQDKRKLAEEVPYFAIKESTPLAAHVINQFLGSPYVSRPFELIEALLGQNVLQEQKVILFEKHIQDFNAMDNSVLLDHLGDKFGEINDPNKTPFIPQNPINRSILEKLQHLGIIRIFPENRSFYQVFH
jgi:hypothetical protein